MGRYVEDTLPADVGGADERERQEAMRRVLTRRGRASFKSHQAPPPVNFSFRSYSHSHLMSFFNFSDVCSRIPCFQKLIEEDFEALAWPLG